ncbi:MAG: hypothetical protein R3B82_06020 [Sandaracinaceae bacterium]
MSVDESEVITQGPVVVFRWRNAPGWPVEYASPNAAEVFGYSADDFVRGDIAYADLVAPASREQVAREVTAATESGATSFRPRALRGHPPGQLRRAGSTTRRRRSSATADDRRPTTSAT